MTENRWFVETYVYDLLKQVEGRMSLRKFRLFVIACCRAYQDETAPDAARRAVDVLERGADGLAGEGELEAASATLSETAARMSSDGEGASGAWASSLYFQARMLEAAAGAVRAIQLAFRRWYVHAPHLCAFLRDIVGNPFRHPPLVHPDWLAWADGTVPRIAKEIYHERSFASLPVLADALEDAGCPTHTILSHLRSPGPHVRECWALDLILRKQ
jgi:hypothetical protein